MITSSKAVNGKRGNLLKKIFYQGRHHKVSIILVRQKLKDVPLGMGISCFDLRNRHEEDAFLDENNYIEKLAMKYHTATKDKYNFLYINKDEGSAYHNFEHKL
jgi:hypothetical protein